MYFNNLSLNIQWFQYFIFSLTTYSISVYVFIKALKLKINKKSILLLLLISIMLSAVISTLNQYNFSYSQILFIIVTVISLIVTDKKKHSNIFTISIISIGISYGIRVFSIFIIGFIFGLFGFIEVLTIEKILLVILQIILSIVFMKIKRFRNGFLFFEKKDNLGLGLIISGIIVIFFFRNMGNEYTSKVTLTIMVIGLFIAAIGLILWIKRSITMHYRKRLEAKAEEYYKGKLAEKEQYIEQLSKSNEFLSKIVHRDNHLMSALEYTIKQYLDNDDQEQKDKMLQEILTMSAERNDLIRKEQISSKVLPSTGVTMIDGALGNMYIKAAAHNIDFELIVSEQIHYLVNNLISQTDMETLLCDHIKDAIIAVESNDNRSGAILVTIRMLNNIYEISIKDNGIDFEIDTLNHLGIERVTTHGDSGGSGIGFMTTFETLKKANASLIITEYQDKQPFSKSVTFRFDGQNNFVIKTYRKSELVSLITRNDLIII